MTKVQQSVYVSPQAETIEIKTQAIICQSGQSFGLDNDTFTNGDLDNPWSE